ncbi:LytTR family transcriptional regulator [Enterococcus saccharolyticus]|uniref:LytTR family DNA-binding domain-containing protein n=1 Tax=Enterococcus saccharolyticus TaxID=41997 RepID=UPI001E508620|nr:LytTR family DNA-binding domain-containing protein [Enterococcus saccharolyticus]MCD5001404.1 LytTR family transcriptional regulator [Enterococcus saccharolyticus]
MEIKVRIDATIDGLRILIESPTNELANELLLQLSDVQEKDMFTVKTKDGIQVVQVHEIEIIEIFADEVVILTINNEKIIFRGRLYKIKERLNGQQFVQITKSTIINIKQIQRLENSFSGNMLAILKSGRKQTISRRYLPNLKKILRQIN